MDGAAVKNVKKCLVVVAMNATCRLSFVHTFKSSKRGKTVNERAKNEGHYTFWQRVEERFPRCISLFKVWKLCKKILYFIIVMVRLSVSCLIRHLA